MVEETLVVRFVKVTLDFNSINRPRLRAYQYEHVEYVDVVNSMGILRL